MKHHGRAFMAAIALCASVVFWMACGGSAAVVAPTASLSAQAASKVYTTDPVSVAFSTAMDQASVEAAFAVTGSDPVTGTFAWDENTVVFTPDERWRTHHMYTITVGADAADVDGNPLDGDIVLTFTPEINLHDVNGDHVDDFMLGAPRHMVDGKAAAGAGYLFLGKSEWSDVDLGLQQADATYTLSIADAMFGSSARIVGDIDGDGYADMAVGGIAGTGYVGIVRGGAAPADIAMGEISPSDTTELAKLDGLMMGPDTNAWLGFPVMPAGDVNGDGLADFIVAGRIPSSGDTGFWLVLGRTTGFADPTTMPVIDAVADAVFTITDDALSGGSTGFAVAACDVNGDEYDDIILGEPVYNDGVNTIGRVSIIEGSETIAGRDLRSEAPDHVITGEVDQGAMGSALACGDVNGDGFGDVVVSATNYNANTGRVYIVAGGDAFADVDLAAAGAAAVYDGSSAGPFFGTTLTAAGDVDDDGLNDIVVGVPFEEVDGTPYRGRAYLFLGSTEPVSVDLGGGGAADATYAGSIPPNATSPGNATVLGSSKSIGDVNGDGIDDIIVGSQMANEGGLIERGAAYIMFGGEELRSADFESDAADVTILGADADDWLSVALAPY